MATETRFPTTTIGADVDIVAGVSTDRANLVFCFTICPSVYLWEDAAKTIPKLNEAQQQAVEYVGEGEYQFWPTVAKVLGEMEPAARQMIVDGAMAVDLDTAQLAQIEKLRNDAIAAWDAMWAAYDQAVLDAQEEFEAAQIQYADDYATWYNGGQEGPAPEEPTLALVPEPSLQDLAAAVGCKSITGPGPFIRPA